MDTWDATRADMQLDTGIIWVCRACPVQGRYDHVSLDAARHDAAGHAVWWHRDTVALTDIVLRLISDEEKQVRRSAALDLPGDAVALVPPMEPLYEGGLSLLQQRIVCDAVGCPEDSRHRRRQRAELGPAEDREAALQAARSGAFSDLRV
ncbi:hypothetical protein ACIQK6_41815 [Streptomyces sp. NPDC091682]|uniref:hypothetical protein n=1 Tax=Streptomyces sp. NPDC091682 TaxID=3366005 RepID=UPI00381CD017